MHVTNSQRHIRQSPLVLLTLLMTMWACKDGSSRARPASLGASEPQAPPDSLIAFVTDRDGNNEIYVMRPDGTEARNVTSNKAADDQPSWAPDGNRIVFVSDRDGNQELYVMDVNGTGVVRLTQTPEDESMPACSPDGKRIAYVVEQNREVYVHFMWADGSGSRRLCQGFAPSWSPDGETIYLNQGQLPVICRVPSWGVDVRPVDVDDQLFNVGPRVSPDGGRILFSKAMVGDAIGPAGMNYEVYVLTEATGECQRLTTQAGVDQPMAWSPDGRRILFFTDRDGNDEVYVMNDDGSAPMNLTNNPATDIQPVWSR